MNLSLESLRCFKAAARSSSFRAAAKLVALTPAALGQRIRMLEDELGARLFVRTTRSVSLTAAGLALVPAVDEALKAVEACARAVKGDAALPVELVMGTRYELGTSFLLPLHSKMTKARPGLTLHYYFGSGPDLLAKVRSREIDCAVTSSRFNDPAMDSVRLHREDYALVGSRELLRQTPLRRAEEASSHTLIDVGPELPLFRYWRDAPDGGDRLRFARTWHVGATAAAREEVLQGHGVGVLPVYMIRRELDSGKLIRILKTIESLFDHFRLVFRADDARRSVFEGLAQVLLSEPLR
jgi:LysR family glycine cleavage system transcriptional activator